MKSIVRLLVALTTAAALAVVPAAGAQSPDGADASFADQAVEILACGGLTPTIVGTPGDDVLVGTNGNDVILARGGNDTVSGNGGADTICGGDGHDTISGGLGNDTLLGGAGKDDLSGNEGRDDLSGGGGNDTLKGNFGDDTLSGGPGRDTLKGGGRHDSLNGNAGNDTLNGGLGHDDLRGSVGNDVLRGLGGDDELRGAAGEDILDGGDGTDLADGGPDADICVNSEASVNCEDFGPFIKDAYPMKRSFPEAADLLATHMTITWDGTNYWSSSGNNGNGIRLVRHAANGSALNSYSPGYDFRGVFTVGDGTGPVYMRAYNSADVLVQSSPGVFVAGVTLVGGTLGTQSNIFWDDENAEFIGFEGGTLSTWNAAGAHQGDVTFIGFGSINNEDTFPQNRGIAKVGSYYLTYSEGVLSAWDGGGNRLDTTVLTDAGTDFDSYFQISFARGQVMIGSSGAGLDQWYGYDPGL